MPEPVEVFAVPARPAPGQLLHRRAGRGRGWSSTPAETPDKSSQKLAQGTGLECQQASCSRTGIWTTSAPHEASYRHLEAPVYFVGAGTPNSGHAGLGSLMVSYSLPVRASRITIRRSSRFDLPLLGARDPNMVTHLARCPSLSPRATSSPATWSSMAPWAVPICQAACCPASRAPSLRHAASRPSHDAAQGRAPPPPWAASSRTTPSLRPSAGPEGELVSPYKRPQGHLRPAAGRGRAARPVVAVAARVFAAFGYRHIVTPDFEDTELFERGVGRPPTSCARRCTPSPTRATACYAASRGHGAGLPRLHRARLHSCRSR